MKRFILFLVFTTYIYADATIFIYHRFGEDRYKSTNTPIKNLRYEFEYLKNNGYKVVPLSVLINKINLKQDIPDNWVVLTIDDSYKSFYKNGLPLFKEYNYPFTLFVYVKATQKRYGHFMRWKELKEVLKYGELGLHSYTHSHMVSMSDNNIIDDTKKALDIFKKHLGFYPKYYAYPYGEFNNNTKNIMKSFGFKAILNQTIGTVTKDSDVFSLNRMAMNYSSKIKQKLKYSSLNAEILEPLNYPKDGIIKRVRVKINEKLQKINLYITGYGWKKYKLKDGFLDISLNLKISKKRVRIMVADGFYKIKGYLLVKD